MCPAYDPDNTLVLSSPSSFRTLLHISKGFGGPAKIYRCKCQSSILRARDHVQQELGAYAPSSCWFLLNPLLVVTLSTAVELLGGGEWIFKYDDENRVAGVAIPKLKPWVMSMDCTYKTNRYDSQLYCYCRLCCYWIKLRLGFAFSMMKRICEVILICLLKL